MLIILLFHRLYVNIVIIHVNHVFYDHDPIFVNLTIFCPLLTIHCDFKGFSRILSNCTIETRRSEEERTWQDGLSLFWLNEGIFQKNKNPEKFRNQN